MFASASCGDSGAASPDALALPGDASVADASEPDAEVAPNHLGQLCMGSCPGTNHHCMTVDGVGATDRGYCSPACSIDRDCARGYDGSSGGMPRCNLGPPLRDPDRCSIVCEEGGHCPSELTCMQVPGAGIRVCVPPVMDTADAGVSDAGVSDAGVSDAGVSDAGVSDASVSMSDGSMSDGSTSDGSMFDGSTSDASTSDASS